MAEDILFSIGADARQSIREVEKLLSLIEKLETEAGEKLSKKTASTGDQIRKIGFAFQRFGVQGVAAFGEIYAAIGPVGIALGALTLGIVGLVKVTGQLARAGYEAFKSLLDQSIEAAKGLELTRAQFTAFFQGDVAASEATIGRLLGLARQLGSETLEIGRAFLPQAESLDQLEQIVKLSTALARFQPEQGITGSRIALQELLSGDIRSIVRRFEVPQNVAQSLQDALDTGGIQAGLDALQDYLEDTGRSIEDLSDTFDVKVGVIVESSRQLAQTLGEPVLDALSEGLTGLFEIMDGTRDRLEDIAELGGEVVAGVVEKISAALQDVNIDEVLGQIQFAVTQVGIITEQLSLIGELSGLTLGSGIETVLGLVQKFSLEIQKLEAAVILFLSLLEATSVAFTIVSLKLNQPFSTAALDTSPVEAFYDVLQKRSQEYADNIRDTYAAVEELTNRQEESNEAGEEAADQFLQDRAAADAYAASLEEVEEALKKVQGAIDDFNTDRSRGLEDLIIKQARAATDQEIENAERRIDAALKNARAIEDIGQKNRERLADQETDLQRDIEDIYIDRARRQVDLEKELADDRLDIEKDYLRELEDINRRFDFSQRQAIRDNDALQFVRLQEQRNFALNEARIDRDRDIEDSVKAAEEKRRKLKEQLDFEIEDARLANQRKLDDIELSLQRELEAQRQNYSQELDDIATQEQRKQDELDRSNAQQLEDFNRTWDRRLEDLRSKYEEELAILQEYQGQELRLIRSHNDAILKLSQVRNAVTGGSTIPNADSNNLIGLDTGPSINEEPINDLRTLAGQLLAELRRQDGISPEQNTAIRNLIPEATRGQLLQIIRGLQAQLAQIAGQSSGGGGGSARQYGGPGSSYSPLRFEGKEAEVVRFPSSTHVTPLSRTFFSPPGPNSGTTNANFNFQSELVNPAGVSPEMKAAIRAEFHGWFMEMMKGSIVFP